MRKGFLGLPTRKEWPMRTVVASTLSDGELGLEVWSVDAEVEASKFVQGNNRAFCLNFAMSTPC